MNDITVLHLGDHPAYQLGIGLLVDDLLQEFAGVHVDDQVLEDAFLQMLQFLHDVEPFDLMVFSGELYAYLDALVGVVHDGFFKFWLRVESVEDDFDYFLPDEFKVDANCFLDMAGCSRLD